MIIRALLRVAASVWLASTVIFFAVRLLPGDPVRSIGAEAALDEATIAQQREALGLTRSIAEQYLLSLMDLLRLDFGVSITRSLPVADLLLRRIPSTVELALWSFIVGSALGLCAGIGIVSAPSILKSSLHGVVNFSLSLPVYWTGTLALFFLSTALNIRQDSLFLPVLVLSFHFAGPVARLSAVTLRTTLSETYLSTARAKGLRLRRIWLVHIFKPTSIPVVSIIALQTAGLLSGTVMTEIIFLRPGIGTMLFNAVSERDYPSIQGCVLVIVLAYVVFVSLADLYAQWADPRLRRA